MLLGLALIVAEVYLVPGLNIVGVAGFLLIVFAVGYSFTEHGVVGGVGVLAGTMLATGATFYWLWDSGAWERFVLATSLRPDDLAVKQEGELRALYLGKVGTAVSPLRPTGIAEIDGKRIEVATEGEFIASGSQVRVVAMDRRRYFVRLSESLEEAKVVRAR